MFCSNCGKQIPDHVSFCPFCGAENKPPSRRNNSTQILLLIVGIALFLIILITAAVLILPKFAGTAATPPTVIRETDSLIQEEDTAALPEPSTEIPEVSAGEAIMEETVQPSETVPIGEILPSDLMNAYNAVMQYPQFAVKRAGDNYMAWHISASNYYDPQWAPNPSGIIDHGNYYEITNSFITVPVIFPASFVSQLVPGYLVTATTVDTNNTVSTDTFRVLAFNEEYNYYSLSSTDDEYEDSWLHPQPDGTAYINFEDGILYTNTIYYGSLYFSKDCKVYNTEGFDSPHPPITVQEYVTKEQDFGINSYEYGKHRDTISFFGYPIFDSSGFIVEYAEQFTS
ncbi:zinc-ribbon domain-containing protein [Clostridium sp. AM58-1XD]|uniref:zinc ribbon domain-containing protein n=1 Tax=Clostridium sp. AM58-1XD TaxID=2292307 RepID=UPI000E48654B|nr:zinc-ribbon domain-containing protein [Clostridium sp. AM58-1XD]RGZ00100.1 zinc-ribbon domain-containing protein [Clostridium sp. AM58-1XD]